MKPVRAVLTATLLLLSVSSALAVPYCWVQSDDCWFNASWIPKNDRTYWTMGCGEEFYSGSLAGDQTGILCP